MSDLDDIVDGNPFIQDPQTDAIPQGGAPSEDLRRTRVMRGLRLADTHPSGGIGLVEPDQRPRTDGDIPHGHLATVNLPALGERTLFRTDPGDVAYALEEVKRDLDALALKLNLDPDVLFQGQSHGRTWDPEERDEYMRAEDRAQRAGELLLMTRRGLRFDHRGAVPAQHADDIISDAAGLRIEDWDHMVWVAYQDLIALSNHLTHEHGVDFEWSAHDHQLGH